MAYFDDILLLVVLNKNTWLVFPSSLKCFGRNKPYTNINKCSCKKIYAKSHAFIICAQVIKTNLSKVKAIKEWPWTNEYLWCSELSWFNYYLWVIYWGLSSIAPPITNCWRKTSSKGQQLCQEGHLVAFCSLAKIQLSQTEYVLWGVSSHFKLSAIGCITCSLNALFSDH